MGEVGHTNKADNCKGSSVSLVKTLSFRKGLRPKDVRCHLNPHYISSLWTN